MVTRQYKDYVMCYAHSDTGNRVPPACHLHLALTCVLAFSF